MARISVSSQLLTHWQWRKTADGNQNLGPLLCQNKKGMPVLYFEYKYQNYSHANAFQNWFGFSSSSCPSRATVLSAKGQSLSWKSLSWEQKQITLIIMVTWHISQSHSSWWGPLFGYTSTHYIWPFHHLGHDYQPDHLAHLTEPLRVGTGWRSRRRTVQGSFHNLLL